MEVKIFSSCIGASNFTAGKSWRSVCFDLVACGENILSVDAGNIRAGSVLAHDLVQPDCRNCRRRINRKFICIFSDMAMGMAAMIYAVLLYFFDLPVWTVFIMLCVRGIGSTFQQPAIQSVIPQLVPENQLVKPMDGCN